jgi:LDH2 family malate/lactate/ureidoglycolate dehydrogenase
VVHVNAGDASVTGTGDALIALAVAFFPDPAELTRDVTRHLGDLRSSARLPGAERMRLRGEIHAARWKERAVAGVPVPPVLMAQLDGLAVETGATPFGKR